MKTFKKNISEKTYTHTHHIVEAVVLILRNFPSHLLSTTKIVQIFTMQF